MVSSISGRISIGQPKGVESKQCLHHQQNRSPLSKSILDRVQVNTRFVSSMNLIVGGEFLDPIPSNWFKSVVFDGWMCESFGILLETLNPYLAFILIKSIFFNLKLYLEFFFFGITPFFHNTVFVLFATQKRLNHFCETVNTQK